MLFKDIKQGGQLYIFDRGDITMRVGTVNTVSFPHISAQLNAGLVIDLGVTIDGESYQYQVKDVSENAYVGTTMISPNVENVLTEVRTLRQQSEEVIRSVDKHKSIIDKCNSLLTDFDPQYKEKQINEQRLSNIEKSIEKLTAIMESMNSTKII